MHRDSPLYIYLNPVYKPNYTHVFDQILKNKWGNVVETLYQTAIIIQWSNLQFQLYIPSLIFYGAHVKSVKHTGLVRFIHWIGLFVSTVS